MAKRSEPKQDDATPTDAAVESIDDAELMTLEELSDRSGVAPRTIRFYQGEKLLQKPERDRVDGRVARYGPAHLERLRLVGELRDRGLKLPAIRTLLAEGDVTTRVADWLGLDESLRGSWGVVEPRIVSREELAKILVDAPAGTQGHMEDEKLLVRQGASWLMPNPGLFDLTLGLIADGVPGDLVLEAGAILRRSLGDAATKLIDLFVTMVGQGYGRGIDTSTLVNAFRPAAGDAARMIFEQQLEHAIEDLLNDTKRLGKIQS
jgi:DNA-binding transcriptional MerR regulator